MAQHLDDLVMGPPLRKKLTWTGTHYSTGFFDDAEVLMGFWFNIPYESFSFEEMKRILREGVLTGIRPDNKTVFEVLVGAIPAWDPGLFPAVRGCSYRLYHPANVNATKPLQVDLTRFDSPNKSDLTFVGDVLRRRS